jgi:hypothetical protein
MNCQHSRFSANIKRLAIDDRPTLTDLAIQAIQHQTDKWSSHYDTPHYEHHFKHLRDEPVNLLEIGVGGYQDPHAGGKVEGRGATDGVVGPQEFAASSAPRLPSVGRQPERKALRRLSKSGRRGLYGAG